MAAPTPTPTPTAPRPRLDSIDALRGLIMILMALDHVRDFFGARLPDPTDVAHASAALFFTRWVTHFCAPVFFLLTGTGGFLASRRKSKAELSRFLAVRGVWLIFLDVVVVRCLGLQFNFDYRVTMLLVLWALGWAMISLAALIHLPRRAILVISLLMIAGHNALDGISPQTFGALAPLWAILHARGFVLTTPRIAVLVGYPLIPWIGVTAAGYALGEVFTWPAQRRRTFLTRLGIALCAAFVVLRALNVYGDPFRWSHQATPLRTALSFLDTAKYPPSLLFLLMTLGPALLLLSALDAPSARTDGFSRLLQPAVVFGRVPLFYYLIHLPLIHLLAVAACLGAYGSAHWMFESPSPAAIPFTPPPGWGFSLPVVYLMWACFVVALYPLCSRFARLKQSSPAAWLSYL